MLLVQRFDLAYKRRTSRLMGNSFHFHCPGNFIDLSREVHEISGGFVTLVVQQ